MGGIIQRQGGAVIDGIKESSAKQRMDNSREMHQQSAPRAVNELHPGRDENTNTTCCDERHRREFRSIGQSDDHPSAKPTSCTCQQEHRSF
jgi:hypothetical protein